MATPEIVIGIDFGTTYSGVSWAVNAGSKQIRVINDWPSPRGNANEEKVPSQISYKDGSPQKWGANVGFNDDSFKWFKILLEPKYKFAKSARPVENSDAMLSRLDKTAIDVVTDYLRFLWHYTLQDIERKQGVGFRDAYKLSVVLTVPAVWTQAAKEKTLAAGRAAGMPQDIELVTEPEAAAIFALKDKSEANDLKIGDCFVVCDAGGGTVDLISYRIEQVHPLRVKETAIGDGGLCGSVFLNNAFEKHISLLVGESQYRSLKQVNVRKMIHEFDTTVKRQFGLQDEQQHTVDLKGVKDDPDSGIEDGTISLDRNSLRAVFDHVYMQIQHLVEKQIDEVKHNGNAVKAILLVGGFGESKYLQDRLTAANENSGIPVLQVVGAWSAVCRGATLWGLEQFGRRFSHTNSSTSISQKPMIVSRLARCSYGLVVREPFDPRIHKDHEKVLDRVENVWMAPNRMHWLLCRGEEIEVGRTLEIELSSTVENVRSWNLFFKDDPVFETDLYVCDDENPPEQKTTSVKKLCSLRSTISCVDIYFDSPGFRSPNVRGKFRHVSVVFEIFLGKATFQFRVLYKGNEIGSVDANYKE